MRSLTNRPKRPTLEELEPRQLLSADVVPLPVEPAPLPKSTLSEAVVSAFASQPSETAALLSSSYELIFVDPRVPDSAALLADFSAQNADGSRHFEIITLDANRDGIEQVTEALADRMQVDAIHFVTHGTDGAVQLGGSWLNAKSVAANAEAVASWGHALKADGDLLFYGCDLASSASGRALVDWIAELTGADAAGSTDKTGAAEQGANWTLEYQHGAIDAQIAVSKAEQRAWNNVLATFIVSNTNDSGAGSLRAAITSANGAAGADIITFNIAGAGQHTITLASDLPNITQQVTIDGTSQPGYTNAPLIVLDGAGVATDGLVFNPGSSGSTIQGLAFIGFTNDGIDLRSNNNLVLSNYIGTSDGVTVTSNGGDGVDIRAGASNNIVRGNVIIGNTSDGIVIDGATTTGNIVQGNRIGVGTDGSLHANRWGVDLEADTTGNIIGGVSAGAGNIIAGNTNDGVIVRSTTVGVQTHNQILGNSIYSNGRIGIDLSAGGSSDGATANDGGDTDIGSNNLQNKPVIASVTNVASALRVQGSLNTTAAVGTYRIEFFLSPAGDPEGKTFLGATSIVTSGAGAASFDVTFTATVVAGQIVTATATSAAGDTSEFSTGFAAPASTPIGNTIGGVIYEDVDGDANVAEAGTVGAAGVTVRLFQDDGDGVIENATSDALVQTAITDASGNYIFTGVTAGTRYWVVVDSKTILPSTGVNSVAQADDLWAEQTYATANAASGAGFTAGAGALYGGRNATASDNATAANTAEHVIRVVAAAGANAGNNFGFSFNSVTNLLAGDATDHDASADRTVQGSLRQFIQNADAMTGANTMRFVPVVATNASAGANTWWRITVTSELPQITDSFTTVDGTAYDAIVDGAVLDTNSALLGYVGAVGLGADGIVGTGDDPAPLVGVQGPELEIVAGPGVGIDTVDGTADDVYVGLDIQTGDVTVRRLSIHGFGHDNTLNATLDSEGDIRIGTATGTFTGSAFDASGILIEDNVIGVGPASVADPGAGNRSSSGIVVAGPDGGTIQNNLIAWAGRFGTFLTSDADNWTVQGNDYRRNAVENGSQDGIDIGNESGNATVRRNYFYQNYGAGVDGWQGAGVNLIENNLFDNNGIGITEQSAIRLFGTDNVVQYNDIRNSVGDGILVVADVQWASVNWPSSGNLITRNSFSGNGSVAIDLIREVAGAAWANNDVGDGANANDNALNPTYGNQGIDTPAITSATLAAGTTTVSGTAGTGATTVEVYKASASGQGTQYLGTAAVVAGSWSLGVTGLAAGEFVNAISIGAANNTSEFSANATVTAPPATISGTIFEDVNGDAQNADFTGRGGVTVRLFRDGGDGLANGADDAYVTFATTNASGQYTFAAQPSGTYWVVVDSRSVTPAAGAAAGSTWAEQTYGVAGALTSSGVLGASGANYGGRNAATSDNSTNLAASLATSDHITRVTLAGSNVTGVDSAFSFNVVTNVRGDGTDDDGLNARLQQGSLNQFIRNANAITGANAMRFVPAVVANQVSGADNWWQIDVTSALPQITGADTEIDGTAYASADGITVLDTNSGSIGAGGTVGTGADGVSGTGDETLLAPVARPELEIHDAAGVAIGIGLDVNAANARIQDLSIWGFGTGVAPGAPIGDIVVRDVSGTVIQNDVIGTDAHDFVDPGPGARGAGPGIFVAAGDGGIVQNNLIGFNGFAGIHLAPIGNPTNNWQIIGNEFRGNAQDNSVYDAVNLNGVGGNTIVRGNLITANQGPGIDVVNASGTVTIDDNTVSNNAIAAGAEQSGIDIRGGTAATTILHNIVTGNTGSGVIVAGAGANATISQNSIYGNSGAPGLGIDLVPAAATVGNGVTANDAGDGDAGGNGLQNFPVLTSAATDSTDAIRVSGSLNSTAGTTFRIELFASAVADPTGNGEGQRYLGSFNVPTDAFGNITFNQLLSGVGVVNPGERVTATATNLTTNSTSEFSQNVTAVAGYDVGGTIYHDVDGDANVVEAGTLTFSGATVRLYADDGDGIVDAGDTLIDTATTNGSGAYSFGTYANGTYYVLVDSTTLTSGALYNAPYDASWIWAEQTYGSAGAAQGAGFLGVSGALYGGRDANTSDVAAAITTAEHITRVLLAGADASGVDSGFSFNAVVTTDDGDDVGGNRTVQGSLRQFIINSNAIDNTSPFGIQSSNFSIGTGVVTIAPTSALPTITDAVILDATTQEGFNTLTNVPIVELRGDSAGVGVSGLNITAGNSTVRGFVINRFSNVGIDISGTGGNTIAGNYIGTNTAGTASLANDRAVRITASNGNTVGGTNVADRNLISGNSREGLLITGAAANNIVRGNYIGTNAAGDAAVGNGWEGIQIWNGPTGTLIGGTAAGAGNLVSGNGRSGIRIDGVASTGTIIQGNYIGTNAAGTGAIANGWENSSGAGTDDGGIYIASGAGSTTIGGTAAGAGNLISGNDGNGITLDGSSGNTIQGNLIGTNAAGNATIGNTLEGIKLQNASANNLVGGAAAGAGNTVAGNGWGAVRIRDVGSDNNRVQGNWFGTNSGGDVLGQGFGNVELDHGASSNLIGGVNAGEGNVIAYADDDGVYLYSGGTDPAGNAILGNRIFGNEIIDGENNFDGIGIDLEGGTQDAYNVTANDAGDGDTGPNALQNYPVIASAATNGTDITITGTLNIATGGSYRLEFFASAAADPSGYGQGSRYLGALEATDGGANDTDGVANGTIAFDVTLSPAGGVAVGESVTATATRWVAGSGAGAAGTDYYETSEFSAAFTAVPADVTPPTLASFSSTTAAGYYNAPDAINITATMSEAVQAGSQITVTLDTGAVVILTAAANGTDLTGTYTVGPGENSADLNVASFVIDSVQDLVGNAMVDNTIPVGQNLADNEALVIDTTPPVPTITLDANITPDDVVNAAEAAGVVSITGTVGGDAQVGDNVLLTINGNNYAGTVAAGGVFSINVNGADLAADADATIDAQVSSTDLAGNTALGNDTETYTVDTTATAAPTVSITEDANNDGLISAAELSGNIDVTVSLPGTAVAGDTVTVTDGITPQNIVLTAADITAGFVSAAFASPGEGNTINVSATVTDLAGNTSAAGNDSATVDTTPPGVPVVDNVISPTATPVLTGTAMLLPGETLAVTVNGATYNVVPDAFGNWTIDLGTAVPASGVLGPFVDLGVYPIDATVTDLAGNTSNAAGTVTVLINDAPVVTTSGGALAYTENDPASVVDGAVTVSDVDNATLASATLQITGGYVAGEDLLSFTPSGGITGSFSAATGTLTLTGPATLAAWQTVLQSVAYQNTSDNPSGAARTVTLIVNDGALDSLPATRTINVTPVNDAPSLTSNNLTITDGATVTLTLANLGASDPDNAWGGLVYTASGVTSGQFEFTSAPGTAINSFTQADVAAGLVVFVHAGNNLAPAYTIQAGDGTLLSAPSAAQVSFTASNIDLGLPSGGSPTGTGVDPGPVGTTVDPTLGTGGSNLSGPTGLGGPAGVARGQESFEEIGEPAPPIPVVSVDTRQAAAKSEPPKVETESMTVASSEPVIAHSTQSFAPEFAQARHPQEITVDLGTVTIADKNAEHLIQLDLDAIRMTSFALSVGAIWWATRATGLIASLLSSLPAWRNFDPLPVLGRNEEDDEANDQWAQAHDAQIDEEMAEEERLARHRFSNEESQPIELEKLRSQLKR